MAVIKVKGENIGFCRDYLCECPEDAIWDRDLGDIFWMGVKAGMMADEKEDISVLYTRTFD